MIDTSIRHGRAAGILVSPHGPVALTPREQAFVDYKKANPGMTQKQIGDHFGVRGTTVGQALRRAEAITGVRLPGAPRGRKPDWQHI